MPYCLIGKLVVWTGWAYLACIAIAGIAKIYSIATRKWQYLAPTRACHGQEFLVDHWLTQLANWADGPKWWHEFRFFATMIPAAIPLVPLGFLELGIRYALKRWHKSTTPTALA